LVLQDQKADILTTLAFIKTNSSKVLDEYLGDRPRH